MSLGPWWISGTPKYSAEFFILCEDLLDTWWYITNKMLLLPNPKLISTNKFWTLKMPCAGRCNLGDGCWMCWKNVGAHKQAALQKEVGRSSKLSRGGGRTDLTGDELSSASSSVNLFVREDILHHPMNVLGVSSQRSMLWRRHTIISWLVQNFRRSNKWIAESTLGYRSSAGSDVPRAPGSISYPRVMVS